MGTWNAIEWPVEKMRKWYEQDGMSVTEIGKKLHRSPKLVWKVCKKHGFHMRPVGASGSKNGSWTGGRIVDKCGYILVHQPDHPNCNSGGYVREHRLVVESMIGRLLTKTEVVHHVNDDPSDNRPENLVLYESNGIHLATTIKGQVPAWTADGMQRMRDGNKGKIGRLQCRPVEWPDDKTLHRMHVEEMTSLSAMAKVIGCSVKRLSQRMHFRGIPVRLHKSKKTVARKQILPTASILSPSELNALRSQGKIVHPTRSNGK